MEIAERSQSDEELMLRFRDRGDESAFEALVCRYGERMRGYIMKYVGDFETSKDLVQELFVRIIKSSETYEPTAKFSSWAYRIATNLAINARKAQKSRSCVSLNGSVKTGWSSGDVDGDELRLLDTIADGSDNGFAESVIASETAGELRRLLARLPKAQREVFEAVVVRGASYEDAAKGLGCSVGTVKSRIFYARRSIRRSLELNGGGSR